MKVLQNHIVGTNFSLQSASITLFICTGQLQSSCYVHHLPFFRHLRSAAVDFYLYGGEAEGVGRDGQTGDKGTAVERAVEIEDEVAEAVEDGAAAVDFNVLGRVGVVADDGVGTGVNEAVGVGALGERGVERVLRAPMEADDVCLLSPSAGSAAEAHAGSSNIVIKASVVFIRHRNTTVGTYSCICPPPMVCLADKYKNMSLRLHEPASDTMCFICIPIFPLA